MTVTGDKDDRVEQAVVNTWRSAARLAETESWAVVGAERTHLLKLSALFRRIADRKG